MPVILDPDDYDRWLDPETPVDELRALLKPYPAERMQAYAVSRAVNSVKNDTEECIEPIGEPAIVTGKPISERVEVPGVRPATFKLVEKGPELYDLYRSARKIGTARVEPNGEWTARFEAAGRWTAAAKSGPELLRLIGTYLLAGEAREQTARPLEETHPELGAKGKRTADEKLSIEFIRRGQMRRASQLDELLGELGKQIKRAPKG